MTWMHWGFTVGGRVDVQQVSKSIFLIWWDYNKLQACTSYGQTSSASLALYLRIRPNISYISNKYLDIFSIYRRSKEKHKFSDHLEMTHVDFVGFFLNLRTSMVYLCTLSSRPGRLAQARLVVWWLNDYRTVVSVTYAIYEKYMDELW